jgi:ABC-type glycerol-3-phosphate transport system substrate-binding protein
MTDSIPNNDLSRRKYVKLFGGTAGAIALAGCSGGEGSGDGSGGNGSGGNGSGGNGSDWQQSMGDSVEVWTSDSTDWPSTVLSDYEEKAEGDLDLEASNLERADLEQRLQSRLLSGQQAPTAAMVELSTMPSYIDQGGIRNITGWIDKAGLKDPLVDAAWGGVTGGDGGQYGVPTDYGPAPWYYRKDVFDDLGIDPTSISTYQELIDAGSDLGDDQYLISIQNNEFGRVWRMFYRQTGGKHLTDDGKINVHSDASVRVVEFMKEAIDSGIANPTASWGNTWFNKFKTGKTPSIVLGAWFEGVLTGSLPDTSGNWRVAKPPMFEWSDSQARGTVWGGSGYCIPDQASDGEAGRMFDIMNHMCSEEMQTVNAEKGNFPTHTAVYDKDVFDQPIELLGGQKGRQVYGEVAKEAPNWVYDSNENAILQAVAQSIKKVVNDDADAAEQMEAAADEIASRTGYQKA